MKFSLVSTLEIDAPSFLLLHPLKMTYENYYLSSFKILLHAILNNLHVIELGSVTHAFNPSTWEAEAGGFLSV